MDEDVVVSAEWLADRLGDVQVVDVRAPWEYEEIGHVPGAINVPFESIRTEDGMLPKADEWAQTLGDAGVDPEDPVVAYDDDHGVFAARFLLTTWLFGQEDVHLLDGDFSSWQREHEVSTVTPEWEPLTPMVGMEDDSALADADDVEAARDDPDAVLVDTRSPSEFEAGHIPGAVNLDWRDLVDEESRGLKPRSEIEGLLADRGIDPGKRVVLYCNTARRLSHSFVVLRWLGYEDVQFYEGSLVEWLEGDREVTGDVTAADVR